MKSGQLLAAVSAVWVASEVVLGLFRHSTRAERRDRMSLVVLWLCIGAATFGGATLQAVRAARIPGGLTTFHAGIALIVIGVVVRWIAILTLRRYFTVDVSIRDDHRVIQHGIYHVVRHPAYLGSLISFIGLGLAFRNWLSLGLIVLASIIGFSYRIAVEEHALVDALGDQYRAYAARTKRLIPGVY